MMRSPLLFLLVLAGCVMRLGPRAENYPPASRADGALASVVTTSGRTIGGELLEVRDTAWLVASENRVVLVPFRVMHSGKVDNSRQTVLLGPPPPPAVMREHRMLSRFPYGLSDSVLREILSSKGQSALEVASP